jgi:hypothetical protein
MNIDDDHMYHGAALIQIAEDQRFTAINSFKLGGTVSRSAYRINDDIGVFLKYATKPTPAHREYGFTFQAPHLMELSAIAKASKSTFVAMVCVKARQICCVPYAEIIAMIEARKAAKGALEDHYVLLVTAPKGKSFRLYMNAPGVKNTMLGMPLIVSRNAFPSLIFE